MKNIFKTIAIAAFTVAISNSIQAQSQISFFHLEDYVSQTAEVSPVYIPKNSFTLGLPSVGLNLASGLAYNEIYTIDPSNNDKVNLNFDSIYENIDGDFNTININETLNILNLSFKRKHGSLSFFVNHQTNVNAQFSKNGILKLPAKGITGTILLNDSAEVVSYAEAGVGFTQQFLNNKLAIGVRVKYLVGIVNGATDANANARIDINDDTTWTINTSDAIARTSGYNDSDNYEFSPKNSGVGFDIGASYEIIPNLIVEAAINDIGSITWKTDVKEYFIEDTTNKVINGGDLRSDSDIFEDILDDLGTGEREGTSYKTSLATTSYLSASYKLFNRHQFRATLFNNHQLEDTEAVLGLGYNYEKEKSTIGVVGIKNDQGEFDFGVNLAAKLGPLQLFAATDNLNQILSGFKKPEEVKQANIRFGLNIALGYNKWLKQKD